MWALAIDGLSATQRAGLAAVMTPRTWPRRAPLFSEGERADGVLVIDSGRVRSFHTTETGQDSTHLVSGQGTVLGLVSVLLQEPAIVSVETLDAVAARHIARPALMALVDTVPRLAFNLGRIAATMYTESVLRGRTSIASAPVRLGRALCRLAQLEPAAPGAGAIHDLTQEDLASMVGATRSWVAQILGHFQQLGLIERHRRGAILIPDLAALMAHVAQLDATPQR